MAETFYTGGPGKKRVVKHQGLTAHITRDGAWTEVYIRDAAGQHVSGVAGQTSSMAHAVRTAKHEMARVSKPVDLPPGTKRG
jgi:hypothetical protein